jgi:hypothetical protein
LAVFVCNFLREVQVLLALLDHADLQKARKALVASSMMVIFLNHLTITSGQISFLGLSVELDSRFAVVFAKMLTAYFLLMYCVRLVEFNSDIRLGRIKEAIEKIAERREISTSNEDDLRNMKIMFRIEVEDEFKERSVSIARTKRIVWFLSEAGIPSILALFSLIYSHSFGEYLIGKL